MTGCCEHGNEPSDCIKCEKICRLAEELAASQEGLRSMEFVTKRGIMLLVILLCSIFRALIRFVKCTNNEQMHFNL